jgi:hypothetical protein
MERKEEEGEGEEVEEEEEEMGLCKVPAVICDGSAC